MTPSPALAALFEALTAGDPKRVVLRGTDSAWSAGQALAALAGLKEPLHGARVLAVLANNSPAWVLADLAALRQGVVHLPLPAFFSPGQLRHALAQSGADRVLTDQPERVEALGLGFARIGTWQGLTLMARAATAKGLPPGTVKISFTSGSTGSPRGVCLGADTLMATASALVARLADVPVHRHLAVLPLALLLENVAGLYAPLLRGAEIHLPPLARLGWRGMAGFDPAALQQAVLDFRPDSLILVPELLKAWCQLLATRGASTPHGPAFVAVGGARVDPGLLAWARNLGLPVFQGYGLTECGSVVCLNRPGADRPGAVGRPLSHVTVSVDGDGQVRVDGPLFLGYLGEPPRSPGPVATGDLGRLDTDGSLHLDGRRDHLIVTAFGRNVAPEWVESALLAQPEIAQALVSGEARPFLGALLVPSTGAGPSDLAAAVTRANAGLPDYARVGAWSDVPAFTPAEGLATGNGRPIRAAIRKHHASTLAALFPVAPVDGETCKEISHVP